MAIFTAIGAAIFGAGTFLASLTSTVLAIAVNVGLSLLQKALAGDQSQEPAGVNGKLQAGGDVPRSFIVGRTCTAGSLAYANTWGTANKTPNAYFTQVIALADHQISNLTGFWVNDAPVTVDTSNPETDKGYPITEYRKDGKDYLWLKWYDGTQTTADPFLVASVSSAGRPYESTRVGTGVAYAIVTSRTNTELFSGFPSFKFEVQGRALYDVSKDTTEGGSGPQRWNDKTTWGGDGDDLPAVQIYNVLRGIYEANVWLYGLQTITAPRLPAADWIAQIAKCRLEVDGAGQGVQYLTGGEISVDTEIGTAIEKILTGCQGRLIESGGVYKIRVGEPDAAVMSFSDGDILSSEEQTFTPFFGLSDTINGVTATYPEPEEAWNTKAAPPIYNPDYEAQDGNRRLMTSVQMDMVYRSIQVQRVMKAALAEARRARRHTFIMPPAYWVLEPGDIVQWTSARNGYVSKLFRVDGIGDGENLDVTVDMTEVDPTDYSWDPDTDYKPPVFSPVGPVHPPTQVMSGWSVAPYTIQDGGGAPRRPAIQVSYDGDLDYVQNVRCQVRLDAGDLLQFDGTSPYGDPATNDPTESVIISYSSILPNTDYEARGQYVRANGTSSDWSDWLAVTTPNVLYGDADVYLPGLVDEINQATADQLAPLNVNIRDLITDARRVAREASNQDAGQYLDHQSSLTQVKSVYQQITADYQFVITAATGPTSAIVQRLETLEATIPGLATVSAVNIVQLNVDSLGATVTAQGTSIAGLNATVGNFSASSLFRTAVVATEAGALATVGISVAATAGGATSQAALLLSALAGGDSMLGLVASKVYITDGTNKFNPFVFTSGVAYLENIVVGTLKFNQLSSNNSKLVIRGSGSLADISVFV